MANPWFETVAEAQRRAKRRLPKGVYGALVAGAEKGLTAADNTAAFDEIGFAPHTAGLANAKNMATRVMGQDVSLPVLISPTGVQAVHPDGEVAVARAAAARGTAMGLSSMASKPMEEVIAANPKTFFQLYWVGDRDVMAGKVERARRAGAALARRRGGRARGGGARGARGGGPPPPRRRAAPVPPLPPLFRGRPRPGQGSVPRPRRDHRRRVVNRPQAPGRLAGRRRS